MRKSSQPKTDQNFQVKSAKPVFAKKSFGQNFLVDDEFVNRIIDELDPQPGETAIEIGAGRGALTRRLIASQANVVAIELDQDLIPILQAEFSDKPNFKLIEADALKVDFAEIATDNEQRTTDEGQRTTDKIKLVANLPYYISTAILQKLIEQRELFSELILMLQREVVERITAEPGASERGFLSVLVEAYADAETLFDVPPTAFRPVPKIWSSVVKLTIKDAEFVTGSAGADKLLWQIVGACFLQKRKTILNNLKNAAPNLRARIEQPVQILESAGIEPARRAETLTLDEWVRLVKTVSEH